MKALTRYLKADRDFLEALVATAATFIFKAGGAVFAFLLSWIVAHRFGAEGFGIFALASTIMTIATTVSLFGLDYSVIQALAAHRATQQWSELRSWVRTASLLASLAAGAVSVALWIGSEKIAGLLNGSSSLSFAIAVLGFAVVPVTVSKILGSYLRGMKRVFQANLVEAFLLPAGAVLLIFCYPPESVRGVTVFYLIAACTCAIAALLFWIPVIRKVESAKPAMIIGPALKKSIPVYLTVLSGFAVSWVTTLTLGAVGTEAEVGVFRVAQQFVLVLALVPDAVAIGMSPQFSALYATNKLHDIARIGRRMTATALLFGGIPALLLFVFAEHALAIFGPDFVSGASTLRILILSNIAALLFGPVGTVMIMTGLERLSLLNGIAGSVFIFLVSLALVPRYGLHGAAIATLLTVTFRFILATLIVWHYRGLLLPLGLTKPRPTMHFPRQSS
jgi:O-antigen/teichoic acid export membrane protein